MNKSKEEVFSVTVDRFDKRGFGEAVVWRRNEHGNKRKLRLIIPESLPGEKVKVTVKEPHRRWQRQRPDQVIKKHEQRIEPRCPHFDRCGGCVWQHLSYTGQLIEKTNTIKSLLRKEGFSEKVVNKPIGMKNPWYYRNKMEFTFSPEGELGLHEQGNFRKVIPLETCFIAHPRMRDCALKVGQWVREHNYPGYDKDKHSGLFRHVMVRRSFVTDEMMIAIFATESYESVDHVDELIKRITEDFPEVKSFLWLENRDVADVAQAEKVHILSGRDFIYDELYGYRYRLWYDTFFQTNPTQAEILVETALKLVDPKENESMFDLFCGVGTFSLPFANRVKHLSGVEIVETSIESAMRNAKDNNVDNTYFLAKDARRGIDEILEKFGVPNIILLDPPRSGAGGKVMRRIGRTKADRVCYVSCNPATFARDIKELEPFGYKLETVQPVDLFPQTVHVELVALLTKK